ncbi:MAG TPA: DUF4236 domain-containing protein [Mycolicibacterium fallax]|nr:DUF4236 domain-containing protein [Mycolicibacterium fallax]
MPIYLRKAIVLGPLRINLSRSGISWSVVIGPWSWNSRARRSRLDLPGPFAWVFGRRQR